MTIEERFDRLTERHEALTMNTELLHRELQDLGKIVRQLAEGTAALSRIVQAHEHRLEGLEGGA